MTPGRVQPGIGTPFSKAPVAIRILSDSISHLCSLLATNIFLVSVAAQIVPPDNIVTLEFVNLEINFRPALNCLSSRSSSIAKWLDGCLKYCPPRFFRSSTITTFNPASAAITAADIPAGPAPITSRSALNTTSGSCA